MTRDQARELFKKSGIEWGKLTLADFQSLRNHINDMMKKSDCFKGTYRCKQRPKTHNSNLGRTIEIHCKSFYFDSREAVTLNRDGFIGFGGWADNKNIQPILQGFTNWILSFGDQVCEANKGSIK